jgi:aryl-alcohol dehydrogenase-like predicted oxidoreductase
MNESLDALKKLQKEGKIKEYRISIAYEIDKIPELSKDFTIVEGYYNLLLKDFEKYESFKTNFIAASPLSSQCSSTILNNLS